MEAPTDRPIRLVVLEDYPVVAIGFEKTLSSLPDLEVVGTAASLSDVRRLVAAEQPDVILADVILGDESALLLPKELGPAGPRVLFYSAHDRFAAAARRNGAAGYISKSEPLDQVVAAVRMVAAGKTVFSPAALVEPPHAPSQREREVLAGVVHGAANKEIAAGLGIEERTVESHLRRLFDRYGIANRTELAVFALREGWVDAAR